MNTHTIIESPQNPLLKSLQALKQPKGRHDAGQILIESLHPVQEALAVGLDLDHVFVREDVADKILSQLPNLSIAPVLLSERAMAKLATTSSAPEVLAVAKRPVIKTLYPADASCVLGLCSLQDPGNFGTLVRSALAFGVSNIALIGTEGVDPYHPKVIRSTAGQVFKALFSQLNDLTTLPPGIAIIAMYAAADSSLLEYQWPEKSLILLGQEGAGLPDNLPDAVEVLALPIAQNVESLNVAVAGSLVLAQRYWQQT